MKKLILLWGLFLLTCAGVVMAQDGICPADLDQPLNLVTRECEGMNRNQVCLAFGTAELNSHVPVPFEAVGDQIDTNAVNTLNINGAVIFSRLQANFSDDAPDHLALIAWGDVTITNNTPPLPNVTATTTANARARSVPFAETDTSVITVIPANVTVQVLGRNAYSDWLYVQLGDYAPANRGKEGWISTQVATINGDRNTLPELDYQNIPASNVPMSEIVIQTGDTPNPCENFPPSGVLLHSASDSTQTAELIINGASLRLNGTAFVETSNDNLNIALLAGRGMVQLEGETRLIVAGTTVGLADGTLSEIAPYDAEFLASLAGVTFATTDADAPLTLSVAEPVALEAIPAQIEAVFAPNGFFDGIYSGLHDYHCTGAEPFPSPNTRINIAFRLDGDTLYIQGVPHQRGGDGRYYVIYENTSSGGIRADGSTAYREHKSVNIYEIVSPTQIRYIIEIDNTTPVYADGYATYDKVPTTCRGNMLFDWQSP